MLQVVANVLARSEGVFRSVFFSSHQILFDQLLMPEGKRCTNF
jgi:hypothetical protein